MNGNVLAAELEALHPEAKVLYMSGYSEGMMGQKDWLDEGAVFLQKPFTIGALGRAVGEMLESASTGGAAD